jgi:ribose-phosphate pyrophosphokinase
MIYVQRQYEYLTHDIFGVHQYEVKKFANQEHFLRIISPDFASTTYVVGSLTAPEQEVIELLLLIHTLSLQPHRKVILFSPYFGYQRQDAFLEKSSVGVIFALQLLQAVKLDSVLTLDLHNTKIEQQTLLPIKSYTTEPLYDQDLAVFLSKGFTFVFPDHGAQVRYDWVIQKYGHVQTAFFIKERKNDLLFFEHYQGKISKKIIIFDDILDSGQTLIQLCTILKQMGVEEIVIFITHGFFHGKGWHDLWAFPVKALFCTNSIPAADKINHDRIYQRSIKIFLQNFV